MSAAYKLTPAQKARAKKLVAADKKAGTGALGRAANDTLSDAELTRMYAKALNTPRRRAKKRKAKKAKSPSRKAKSNRRAFASWEAGHARATSARRRTNKKRKAAGKPPIKARKAKLHWVKRHKDKKGRTIKRHLRNPDIPQALKSTLKTAGGVALAVGGLVGVVKLLDWVKPTTKVGRVGILAGSALVGGAAIGMLSPAASAMYMLPLGIGALAAGFTPVVFDNVTSAIPMAGVYQLGNRNNPRAMGGLYKVPPAVNGLYDAKALAAREERQRIDGLFRLVRPTG